MRERGLRLRGGARGRARWTWRYKGRWFEDFESQTLTAENTRKQILRAESVFHASTGFVPIARVIVELLERI